MKDISVFTPCIILKLKLFLFCDSCQRFRRSSLLGIPLHCGFSLDLTNKVYVIIWPSRQTTAYYREGFEWWYLPLALMPRDIAKRTKLPEGSFIWLKFAVSLNQRDLDVTIVTVICLPRVHSKFKWTWLVLNLSELVFCSPCSSTEFTSLLQIFKQKATFKNCIDISAFMPSCLIVKFDLYRNSWLLQFITETGPSDFTWKYISQGAIGSLRRQGNMWKTMQSRISFSLTVSHTPSSSPAKDKWICGANSQLNISRST